MARLYPAIDRPVEVRKIILKGFPSDLRLTVKGGMPYG